MKPGTYFQHQLNSLLMFTLLIMSFFVYLVIFTMFYIKTYKTWVLYLGHQKAKMENLVFMVSGIALIIMGIPSIRMLYISSNPVGVDLVVKIMASQWYWSFEVSDLFEDPIYMYMMPSDELNVGDMRYLEVDNRLILPLNMRVQFNVTSSDVIHSFALPTLGMKVDATPGLLTVVYTYTTKVGSHYGQCSEICGMNHAFMPFCCEIVPFMSFMYWAILNME